MLNIKSIIGKIYKKFNPSFSTVDYWESRYHSGGDSGKGSYKHLADFKATVMNEFLDVHPVKSVVEFGCGDGNQLSLIHYPRYLGLDVSRTSIQRCSETFKGDTSKSFLLYDPYSFSVKDIQPMDVGLSMDVIFHLIEDDIYELYMQHLFSSASQFVIVYSSDFEQERRNHERRRKFTKWIELNQSSWKLVEHKENPFHQHADPEEQSPCDFYIYGKS